MKKLLFLVSLGCVALAPVVLTGCGGGGSLSVDRTISGLGTLHQSIDIGLFLETDTTTYAVRNLPSGFGATNNVRVSFKGRRNGTFTDPFGGTIYPILELSEIVRQGA